MLNIQKNVNLRKFTTLGIGGDAKLLIEIKSLRGALKAFEYVSGQSFPWVVIGEGSDLLVSDNGFDGIVLANRMNYWGVKSGKTILVGAGANLNEFVDFANRQGVAGFENLAGIPGTVGGAVYGNAGAYGQTICDQLISVNSMLGKFTKEECKFGYRDSIFKHKQNFLLEVEFSFDSKHTYSEQFSQKLQSQSHDIRNKRRLKYPPELKCPGSFFKNVIASDLSVKILRNIPVDKVINGKIPSGYLLAQIGACGMRVGGARVAGYHGNLIINDGKATATEIWQLAMTLKSKVEDKFGISLEPEVQMLGKI